MVSNGSVVPWRRAVASVWIERTWVDEADDGCDADDANDLAVRT